MSKLQTQTEKMVQKTKRIIICPYAQKMRMDLNPLSKINPKNYKYFPELIQLLKKEGYYLIQIGKGDEEKLQGIDEYQFDLSFKELKVLLDECYTWISVDSFFPHFAAYYQKKGIAIFTVTDPKIFGHDTNINLLKGRMYLRPDQFVWHEKCPWNDNAHIEPEKIIKEL